MLSLVRHHCREAEFIEHPSAFMEIYGSPLLEFQHDADFFKKIFDSRRGLAFRPSAASAQEVKSGILILETATSYEPYNFISRNTNTT
jgi:hypothetical protein